MQPNLMIQRYSNFDVKMTWEINTIDKKTVVDGIIQNIRYSLMENLEIWVASVDSNGKTVCRAVDLVVPRRLDMDESAAFKVEFPIVVPTGSKLVFTYKYEGCDGGDGLKWMQTFDSCVP